jgi:hypothetical protein
VWPGRADIDSVTEGVSGRAEEEDVGAPDAAGPAVCVSCGAPLVTSGRTRRAAATESGLCLSCDRRERRSSYFRTYYEAHRDRILDKNRKWAKDNRERLVQLRRARQFRKSRSVDDPRRCLDCGEVVVRALRCRRCYTRYRYATDPEYRVRRLATTRRWLERRRSAQEGSAAPQKTQKPQNGSRRAGEMRLSSRPAAPTSLTA